jgi:hypothetical protein
MLHTHDNNILNFLKDSKTLKESSRIIDGKAVSEPISFMVALLDIIDNFLCGGVLLSNTHILSAAHCEKDLGNLVRIGAESMEDESSKHIITSRHLIHPMHEYFKDDDQGVKFSIYDFMLLFLETPLRYCNQNFAKLPSFEFSNEHYLADKVLTLNGYGSTKPVTREQVIAYNKGKQNLPLSLPFNLQQIHLRYLRNRVCQRRFQDFLNRYKNVRGRKLPNNEYTEHTVNQINFGGRNGLSMLCTSTCTEEDLNQCSHQHQSQSACSGDSGCT